MFFVNIDYFHDYNDTFCVKKSSDDTKTSKYILNKFEPDNITPKLTEMIEFHKSNNKLSKYNVK